MKKNLCFFECDGLCFLVNVGTSIKPEMIEYFSDTNPVECWIYLKIIQNNVINGFMNHPEIIDFKGKICFSLS